jgi:uncharacterized membrane protein
VLKESIDLNKKFLRIGVIVVIVLIFCITVFAFNKSITKESLIADDGMVYAKATVTEILENNIPDENSYTGSQVVKATITSGQYKGMSCEVQNMNGYLYGANCKAGTKIIVQLSGYEGNISASVYGYDRAIILYVLIGLFLATLCLIGGRKGINSAIGLIFTYICIIYIYIPMMYVGQSPFLAAVIIGVLTTIVTMLLIGGFSIKSLSSILGTIAGVIIAGLIASIFGKLSHITGYNVSDIEDMIYVAQTTGKLQVGGILFSGILIASLGAIMDISMSIASTINEIYDNSPGLTGKNLFKSGIRVGKDMMGTMSNTLILAFTGSSINTIIMIYAYQFPYLRVINMYSIGIEILQGISGALGVIITVPIVSAISTLFLTYKSKNLLANIDKI